MQENKENQSEPTTLSLIVSIILISIVVVASTSSIMYGIHAYEVGNAAAKQKEAIETGDTIAQEKASN